MQQRRIRVKPEWAGLPVDQVLVKADLGLSRKKIRKILDMGGIQVEGRRVRVASLRVQTGETITLSFSVDSLSAWSKTKFQLTENDILYEGNHLVAVNKPPLLASQPQRSKEAPHAARVLAEYFAQHRKERLTFHLCHRLDKETSGVLLLAENEVAVRWAMQQFKDRLVEKTYLALCFGKPKQKEWQVVCHLSGIDSKSGMVRILRAGGDFSRTEFKLVEYFPDIHVSLVACYPETGRSHQIRVHLASVGLPIVGDKKYAGEKAATRLPTPMRELTLAHHFLHAQTLQFRPAPNASSVTVEALAPLHFSKFLAKARSKTRS